MHRSLFVLAPLAASFLLAACQSQSGAPTDGTSGTPSAASSSAAPAKAAGAVVTVGLELADPALVGALQVDVAYKGSGRFVGDADAVDCETLLEGALSSYNHIAADRTLKAAFVAIKGFNGPIRFAQCKFQGGASAGDFQVTVRDAASPDLEVLDPPPAVRLVVD